MASEGFEKPTTLMFEPSFTSIIYLFYIHLQKQSLVPGTNKRNPPLYVFYSVVNGKYNIRTQSQNKIVQLGTPN